MFSFSSFQYLIHSKCLINVYGRRKNQGGNFTLFIPSFSILTSLSVNLPISLSTRQGRRIDLFYQSSNPKSPVTNDCVNLSSPSFPLVLSTGSLQDEHHLCERVKIELQTRNPPSCGLPSWGILLCSKHEESLINKVNQYKSERVYCGTKLQNNNIIDEVYSLTDKIVFTF